MTISSLHLGAIERYLTTKPDYLNDFNEDEVFNLLYSRHSGKFYLAQITAAMLEELGVVFSQDSQAFSNFQSWVYMRGQTLRKQERHKKAMHSAELCQTIKSCVGQRLALTIEGDGAFGNQVQQTALYRIQADADGRIFLLPPRAKRRGYYLDKVTVLKIGLSNLQEHHQEQGQ